MLRCSVLRLLLKVGLFFMIFFFQAEDGIRDIGVTGVQTCALPICKTFHAAGCRFIHDKAHLRTIAAGEAIREGYAPCMRCMRKYLELSSLSPMQLEDADDSENHGSGY